MTVVQSRLALLLAGDIFSEGVQPFGVVARGSGVGIPDGEVYSKHKEDLIRYATALVGPNDAEDVVATVVLRVLQRRRLSDLEEPRPYLFRAVLNEARGLLRNRARPSGTAELVDAAVGVDREVLDAVLRLPVRQRAVVYLVYWEGYTVKDASQLLRITPGTAKRYLHLARRRLRKELS
ncbi:MAG: sigma-70 family RNA polymerase sigma factor [Acidobacteria bacterium]|nr:sigma-70 family RNA polymerase sigma factor [Acidobacteriota bacterium]